MNQTLANATPEIASPAGEITDRLSLGALYVLCVPLAAGAGAIREVYFAGVSYTSLLWMAFLFFGFLLLVSEWALCPEQPLAFPWRPWLLWLGYVWLSLIWCEKAGRPNVQEAAQISTPVLIGVIASCYVRSAAEYRLLVRSFALTLPLLVGCVAATLIGVLGAEQEEGGVYRAVRPLALTGALAAAVFLAGWQSRKVLPWVGWLVCVLLAAVTGGRMATAALLLVPIVHPLYRGRLARVAVAGALLVAALALFYLPSVQERFFYSGSGSLAQISHGDFRDSGRSEIWLLLWDRMGQHPVLGAGVGSSGRYLLTVWSNMSHPHNDYLRVFYDLGGVGLATFLALVCWQLADLARGVRQTHGATQCAFAAAMLGFLVFLFTAITDNPLVYHLWYMNPLFAVMGAAYGMRQTATADKESHG